MASFEKRQKEKKRQQKKEEKMRRKEERKANSSGGGLENMMAYVDEHGRIVDTPPDPANKIEVDASEIELGIPKKEDVEIDPVHRGKVDFFDTSKGFGFINEEGGRDRYFFHISGTEEEVFEGDKVTFELEKGPRGLNAVKVKKA